MSRGLPLGAEISSALLPAPQQFTCQLLVPPFFATSQYSPSHLSCQVCHEAAVGNRCGTASIRHGDPEQ